eukprot:TRINITY_DN35221_c0_g1_i1.p1 TRINITY_DN35221_c0_g1~~TRINITY_DN35221_c0_g1_i1.p1  ORF type:complete len:349 (+),score=82.43 TRINITY_DN35221_c0_g1_i1:54-1100(+)
MEFGTQCVHGYEKDCPDVVPPITTSVTFRSMEGSGKVYSRMDGSQPVREKVESVLGRLEGGSAVLYASGQAAAFSLLRYLNPKRVAMENGYHGTGQVVDMLRITKVPMKGLDTLEQGDVLWLETPLNPTCEVFLLRDYTPLQAKGVVVCVDGTFAPPPVQFLLEEGADFVVHSSTKFLNGHSDAMGGVVVSKRTSDIEKLKVERMVMGNTPGTLDSWLLLRSLKTLEVRVRRQCETALRIVDFLKAHPDVTKVHHPSLLPRDAVAPQMRLHGAILSFETPFARTLPSHLTVFQNATSLGSVESLIEWRHRWDPKVSPSLLRISVGLEAPDDLVKDLAQALQAAKASKL